MTGRDLSLGSLCEKVLQCPSHTLTPHSLLVGPVSGGSVSLSQLLQQLIILQASRSDEGSALFSSSPLPPSRLGLFLPYTQLAISLDLILYLSSADLLVDLCHINFLFGKLPHSCFSQYYCNYFHPELVIRPPAVGSHSSS